MGAKKKSSAAQKFTVQKYMMAKIRLFKKTLFKIINNFQKNPIYYQKTKICKYCEALFPEHELNHALTYKMILQTDRHLIVFFKKKI